MAVAEFSSMPSSDSGAQQILIRGSPDSKSEWTMVELQGAVVPMLGHSSLDGLKLGNLDSTAVRGTHARGLFSHLSSLFVPSQHHQ